MEVDELNKKQRFRRTVRSVKARHYASKELIGRGRSSKLNPFMISNLGEAIARGHVPKIACASVNIGYETFLRWLKKGASDYERVVSMAERGVQLVDQDYSLEYDLYIQIQESLYHSQNTPLEVIKQASKAGDWRAAAHFLERRFPSDWGKRIEQKIDANVSGKVDVQTVVMVPNQSSTAKEWEEAVEAYKNDKLEYLPEAEIDKEAETETKAIPNLDILEGN